MPTASLEPSATLLPTETAEPTITPLPSETPTSETTIEPTLTITPSETATESPTSEATLMPSEEATIAPEATLTLEPTSTPETVVLPQEPTLGLIVSDNFDSGDLANWAFERAGWALIPRDAGQALQVFNTHAPAQLLQADQLNIAAEMSVLLDHGGARLSVRHSAAGRYSITLDAAGQVNLYRADNLMASVQVAASAPGQWRTLRLSAIQDVLRVRVDGVEVIVIQDDPMLPPGHVSVSGVFDLSEQAQLPQNTLQIDDFRLFVPEAEIPAPTPTPIVIPPPELPGVSVIQAESVFTVNSTADPGDGLCDATECTLREAITAANANAGFTDTIAFNITSAGAILIRPTSALPAITDPVIIDGQTEPDFVSTPIVELNGGLAGSGVSGLTISGGNSTVRGLVISGFQGNGIHLISDNNVIIANYIGTNTGGTSAKANLQNGVRIEGSNNEIGRLNVGEGNLISGNTGNGIYLIGATSQGNKIALNKIGIRADSSLALANQQNGIEIISSSLTEIRQNVIAGNNGSGIVLDGAVNTTIQNNGIGSTAAAISSGIGITPAGPRPNIGHGIWIKSGSGTVIGGTAGGQQNSIAFNNLDGIFIEGGTGHLISANAIIENGDQGIDLGMDGVALNDSGDGDSGANNLQNFPVIDSAINTSTELIVAGTFNSQANTTYQLAFFNTATCDPSGYGEGRWHLDTTSVTTDGSGNANFNYTIPLVGSGGFDFELVVNHGSVMTATATDPQNNTSEFSPCAPVTPVPLVVNSTADPGDGTCDVTECTLREAITAANANSGITDRISFNISGAEPHTIQPASPLPEITDPVIIDGQTEPNFVGTPIVELDGSLAGSGVSGLLISAGNSTVRGLVINNFSLAGIRLIGTINPSTGTRNIVVGNYIGTEPNGSTAGPNGDGIQVCSSSNNRIGGITAADRNVISGNTSNGIVFCAAPGSIWSIGNLVQGNYIGLDVSGENALGNGANGINLIYGSSTIIGGTASGAGNVISGNADAGILLTGGELPENPVMIPTPRVAGSAIQGNYIGTDNTGSSVIPGQSEGISLNYAPGTSIGGSESGAGNVIAGHSGAGIRAVFGRAIRIRGNYIGTDPNGNLDLGNGGAGIDLSGSGNFIGGPQTGEGNTISFNTNYGIVDRNVPFVSTDGNLIQGNRIFSNEATSAGLGLGIDLSLGGVTTNDAGDGDTFQNYPVLTSAEVDGSTLSIEGTLNSTSDTTFRVEFFANDACDPSGFGEGQNYIGTSNVTTDGSGNATIAANLSGTFSIGQYVTATATDPQNFTSEFSACMEIAEDDSQAAQTFTVNSTADPGDGTCDATECTLREAIHAANANADFTDTIAFNIPSAGPHTIQPASPLPEITDPVIIDGQTQPGFTNTPIIEIDGVNVDTTPTEQEIGLNITAGNSTVRGLVINNFGWAGIRLSGGGNNIITGNYIGTEPDGISPAPNGSLTAEDATPPPDTAGIIIDSSANNQIGGTNSSARNVISGNIDAGIAIIGAASTDNRIQGNYIGTNADGTAAVTNGFIGISISDFASENLIGGSVSGARNVISGNGLLPEEAGSDRRYGVAIWHDAHDNTIQGNYVGINATGTAAIGNGQVGVFIGYDAGDNRIGGATAAERNVISGNEYGVSILLSDGNAISGNYIGVGPDGTTNFGASMYGILIQGGSTNLIGGDWDDVTGNVIAYSGQAGIYIWDFNDTPTVANAIVGNQIFNNSQIGIDLETELSEGVTANDSGDADTGANNLQNYPVLTSATISGGSLNVNGTLNSSANTIFRIEYFLNEVCHPSGYGEGQIYIGTNNVTTDASGNVTIATNLSGTFSAGQFVTTTATATSPQYDTSEFSACVEITSVVVAQIDLALTMSDAPDPVILGEDLTYTLTVSNNGPDTASAVHIEHTLPANVSFVSATFAQGGCLHDSGVVTCDIAILNNGASVEIPVIVTVNAGAAASLNSSAAVSANEADTNAANDSASATTSTQPPPKPTKPALSSPANNARINSAMPELTWNEVDFASSYVVQIDDDSRFRTPEQAIVTEPSYTPTSPLANRKYYWRVRAVNMLGVMSSWSNVRNFTVDTVAPTAPALLRPADGGTVTTARPQFRWKAAPGANRYRIQVSDTGSFTGPLTINAVITKTSYTSPVSLPQGTYQFQVQALDAAGNESGFNPAFTFRVDMQRAPRDQAATTDTAPTFRWYRFTGATGYRLEVAADAAFNNPVAPFPVELGRDATSYTPSKANALPHGVYYWRLSVDMGSGFVVSPFQRTLIVSPAFPKPPALTGPANNFLAKDGPPQLTWNATTSTVGAPFSYLVQIDDDSRFRTPQQFSTSDLFFTPPALADGKYHWRVRTLNDLGAPGGWSKVRSFTLDTTAPVITGLTSPVDGASITNLRPTFRWKATGSPKSFDIQIGVEADPTAPRVTVNKATYTPASALSATTYYWRVRARDAAGNVSDWTEVHRFTIVSPNNAAPPLNFVGANDPVLRWTPISWALGYEVQIASRSNFSQPEYRNNTLTTNDLILTVSTPLPNGTYYWRVRAKKSATSWGNWSSAGIFQVER